MPAFKGFFDLQTPGDLLQKLRHDFTRLQTSPADSYTAFDFFVTAYHMLDWLYPGDSNKAIRGKMEIDSNLLQVCSHLANGLKHFQATRKRHRSVKGTVVKPGAFQANAFQQDAFQVDELRVELDGPAAGEFGASIGVLELARNALDFWEGLFRGQQGLPTSQHS